MPHITLQDEGRPMFPIRVPSKSRWALVAGAAGLIVVTAIPGVVYAQSQQDTTGVRTVAPAPSMNLRVNGKEIQVVPGQRQKIQIGPGQTMEVEVRAFASDSIAGDSMVLDALTRESMQKMMTKLNKMAAKSGIGQLEIDMDGGMAAKQAPPQIRTDDTQAAGTDTKADSGAAK